MYACMYAEIETDGDEEEDTIQPPTLEEKLVSFGPYNPPAGWTVLPIPILFCFVLFGLQLSVCLWWLQVPLRDLSDA